MKNETAIYRFSSNPKEPMLTDVGRMTDDQLEKAAGDSWNIYRELALREQRLREAMSRTAEEMRS